MSSDVRADGCGPAERAVLPSPWAARPLNPRRRTGALWRLPLLPTTYGRGFLVRVAPSPPAWTQPVRSEPGSKRTRRTAGCPPPVADRSGVPGPLPVAAFALHRLDRGGRGLHRCRPQLRWRATSALHLGLRPRCPRRRSTVPDRPDRPWSALVGSCARARICLPAGRERGLCPGHRAATSRGSRRPRCDGRRPDGGPSDAPRGLQPGYGRPGALRGAPNGRTIRTPGRAAQGSGSSILSGAADHDPNPDPSGVGPTRCRLDVERRAWEGGGVDVEPALTSMAAIGPTAATPRGERQLPKGTVNRVWSSPGLPGDLVLSCCWSSFLGDRRRPPLLAATSSTASPARGTAGCIVGSPCHSRLAVSTRASPGDPWYSSRIGEASSTPAHQVYEHVRGCRSRFFFTRTPRSPWSAAQHDVSAPSGIPLDAVRLVSNGIGLVLTAGLMIALPGSHSLSL